MKSLKSSLEWIALSLGALAVSVLLLWPCLGLRPNGYDRISVGMPEGEAIAILQEDGLQLTWGRFGGCASVLKFERNGESIFITSGQFTRVVILKERRRYWQNVLERISVSFSSIR